MKKFFSIIMCTLLAVSLFALVGCDKNKDETSGALKFGSGVFVSTPAATDATEDKEGTGKLDVTAAALTVDADGKIVSCALDTMSNSVKFTFDGKAVANDSFATKYEAGESYGMVAWGGSAKEWFEQADAFEAVVSGKTLDEVKALVAEGDKGTDEVINAGCTIQIHEFVGAIEKAYNAAKESSVTAADVLKVCLATEQTCTDATEEKDGTNKVATTVFAAAVNADGKVVDASSDCVEVSFTFDMNGVSTLDTTKEVLTKKEQGDGYGMVAWAGSEKEWFEQAAEFDKACIGKTGAEIAGLAGEDGKGIADLQNAGCTIYVTGFVKAASKIG